MIFANGATALPKGGKVVEAVRLGLSKWCDTTRIDVQLPDGTTQRFFEKVRFPSAGMSIVVLSW
jgi:hypothetical protein